MSQNDPGPATDAGGNPVLDPTSNVMALVAAANQRQDDLREIESKHIREILDLRAEHVKEARESEAARINAIRAVDVQAVQQAAEVQTTQAQTLAATVSTSAEAMRSQVAAAASAAVTGLAAALEPIQKDIQDLRKAQYEAQGQKTQVVETRAVSANSGMWWGVAIAAAGMFVLMTSVAVALIIKFA